LMPVDGRMVLKPEADWHQQQAHGF
jgi:hypothetical protein